MSDFDVLFTRPPPLEVTVTEGPNPRVEVGVGEAPGGAALGVVEVRVPGPQGPPGPVAEGAGDANFVHSQALASDEWLVEHGLGKFPAVSVMDTSGKRVHGSVHYPDLHTVRLGFSAPFSGTATCN